MYLVSVVYLYWPVIENACTMQCVKKTKSIEILCNIIYLTKSSQILSQKAEINFYLRGFTIPSIFLKFQIPPHSKELIFDQKARSLDESRWIQQKSIQFWRVWKFVKQLDWEILGLRKFFKIKRELFSFVELRKNLDNLAKIWQKSDQKYYRLYAYV